MWRLWAFFALAVFVSPTHAQIAWPGYQPPDWSHPQPQPEVNLAQEKTALNNAREMLRLFSFAHQVDTVGVFSEAQTKFHDTYFGYLKAAMKLAIKAKIGSKRDQALLEVAIEALDKVQGFEDFVNDFLMYQRATTPDTITLFYADTLYAPKVLKPDAQNHEVGQYWLIDKDKPVPLRFFVVLSSPQKRVPTPTHLAKVVANRIRGVPPILQPELQKGIREAIVAGLAVAAKYLNDRHVLNYGFRIDPTWLASPDDTVLLGGNVIKQPIDIGDGRVVKISALTKEVLAYGVTNDPARNLIYVKGHKAGYGSLWADFQDKFKQLRINGAYMRHRMAFKVEDPKQQRRPDIAEPMPVLNGPLVAPKLPPPSLPAQPQPVAVPPLPAPGAHQEPAPWTPCGNPSDGGTFSPYSHKCEYPK